MRTRFQRGLYATGGEVGLDSVSLIRRPVRPRGAQRRQGMAHFAQRSQSADGVFGKARAITSRYAEALRPVTVDGREMLHQHFAHALSPSNGRGGVRASNRINAARRISISLRLAPLALAALMCDGADVPV